MIGRIVALFDVIVVGTGAGGGTLARRLATGGKRVLILERGDFLPQEPENWDSRAVWREHRYRSDTWYDHRGRPFDPHVYYYVGGSTKLYGATLCRLRREDFGDLTHHGGVSPAWPISHEDLEPYYCEAEQYYQVHGRHGADPTDPPASQPLPHPPVRLEPLLQQFFDELAKKGRPPGPLPIGLVLDERDPNRSSCELCRTCDGHPCKIHGKCDAAISGVGPALEYHDTTLVTRAEVLRLETDTTGRAVTNVVARVNGREERYAGHFVALAAGAANTAKILLNSRSDQHPNGLANGSDQVGRNYMCHNRSVMIFARPSRNPTTFQKTLTYNGFYFGAPDFEFPLGNVQFMGKIAGAALKGRGNPVLLSSFTDWLADRTVDFFLQSEDLPDPNNRVTVQDGERIVIQYQPNNVEAMTQLIRHWKRLVWSLPGFRASIPFVHRVRKGGLGHQMGTCRFGHDRSSSVLDVNCKAHELENLYVADASFFPTSGAINPSLTIAANAIRVADHLLQRLQ